jgi:hypothetical protein
VSGINNDRGRPALIRQHQVDDTDEETRALPFTTSVTLLIRAAGSAASPAATDVIMRDQTRPIRHRPRTAEMIDWMAPMISVTCSREHNQATNAVTKLLISSQEQRQTPVDREDQDQDRNAADDSQ